MSGSWSELFLLISLSFFFFFEVLLFLLSLMLQVLNSQIMPLLWITGASLFIPSPLYLLLNKSSSLWSCKHCVPENETELFDIRWAHVSCSAVVMVHPGGKRSKEMGTYNIINITSGWWTRWQRKQWAIKAGKSQAERKSRKSSFPFFFFFFFFFSCGCWSKQDIWETGQEPSATAANAWGLFSKSSRDHLGFVVSWSIISQGENPTTCVCSVVHS